MRYQAICKANGLCTRCGQRPFEKEKDHLKNPLCGVCAEAARVRRRKYPEKDGCQRLESFADFLRLDKRMRAAIALLLHGKSFHDPAIKFRLHRRGILDGNELSDIARHLFVIAPCGVAVFKEVVSHHRVKCTACKRLGG